MVAGRHTLLDQSAAVEVFPHCRRHGTRVVAAAVFNSGLLADGPRYDYGPVPDDVLARTRRISGGLRGARCAGRHRRAAVPAARPAGRPRGCRRGRA